MKPDIYQRVTDSIIAKLAEGTSPWRCTWDRDRRAPIHMPRRATGEFYRGINVLLLWAAAEQGGFKSDRWFTFNQAKALGGMVRKGEKASLVVFFKKLDITETNAETGQDEEKSIPMMRQYCVFNADQIDGLPDRYLPAPMPAVARDPKERDPIAEAALRSSGADITEEGDRAFYAPARDTVTMPEFERFHTAGAYLATLAHELCHWTGHASRLDRAQKNAFGSKDYAFEELVAEIGAAFVGARLGIVGEHIDNHASYIASWLKALQDDKRMIFKAAAAAQAAADLVLVNATIPEPEGPGDEDEDQDAPQAPAPALLDAPEARDPAEPQRQRQRARMKARAPMQAKADQASTAGLGLFDFVDAPALV